MTSYTTVILMDETLSAERAVEVYSEARQDMREDQSNSWQDDDIVQFIVQAPGATLREIAIEALFRADYITVWAPYGVPEPRCLLIGPTVGPGPKLQALLDAKAKG